MRYEDIGQLLAGLGLFLYGLFLMEEVIKQFDGRGFKLFFKKHTNTKLSAIFSGTVVTAVMQSSSIVNLMVLSFVGAGMLSMRNALAVVLGANIGGTVNSWLVALLGFKTNIASFTLPIIGIAGVLMIIFRSKIRIFNFARFMMGIGLLFLGLEFMKASMDFMIKDFDLSPFLRYPRIVLLLIGFVITAIIQTSAATVVVVLAALYAHVIPLESAVAIVLGSELGTAIKVILGSIGGIAAKKRVALGNILFNLVTTILGYLFLLPLIVLLRDYIGFRDPIIILVAFQSLINIAGALLFYFFLNFLGDFLDKRFKEPEKNITHFIHHSSPKLFDTAIEMLEKEVGLFINRVIYLNMEVFHLNEKVKPDSKPDSVAQVLFDRTQNYQERYQMLKQSEGEILSFYARMSKEEISKENFDHLNQLIEAVRNGMYSAKGMKDISHNKREFSNSANERKYLNYEIIRSKLELFYSEMIAVMQLQDQSMLLAKLIQILDQLKSDYNEILNQAFEDAEMKTLKSIDIASLFNVNLELYTSGKALVDAVKDYLLDTKHAENLNDSTDVETHSILKDAL